MKKLTWESRQEEIRERQLSRAAEQWIASHTGGAGRKLSKKERRQKHLEAHPRWKGGSYSKCLCSKWWRKRRRQAIRDAKWRCEKCRKRGRLQVHHLSYERLGCERRADLQALCPACHEHEHADIIAMNAHLDAIARQ